MRVRRRRTWIAKSRLKSRSINRVRVRLVLSDLLIIKTDSINRCVGMDTHSSLSAFSFLSLNMVSRSRILAASTEPSFSRKSAYLRLFSNLSSSRLTNSSSS